MKTKKEKPDTDWGGSHKIPESDTEWSGTRLSPDSDTEWGGAKGKMIDLSDIFHNKKDKQNFLELYNIVKSNESMDNKKKKIKNKFDDVSSVIIKLMDKL